MTTLYTYELDANLHGLYVSSDVGDELRTDAAISIRPPIEEPVDVILKAALGSDPFEYLSVEQVDHGPLDATNLRLHVPSLGEDHGERIAHSFAGRVVELAQDRSKIEAYAAMHPFSAEALYTSDAYFSDS